MKKLVSLILVFAMMFSFIAVGPGIASDAAKAIVCINHADCGGELHGALTFQKTVDGLGFSIWLDKYLEQFDVEDWFDVIDVIGDLLGGMSFELFAADGTLIAEAEIDPSGTIFTEIDAYGNVSFVIKDDSWYGENYKLIPGDYYIVEYLTGTAAEVFKHENNEVRRDFTAGPGEDLIDDFDYTAFYTIVNGHGDRYIQTLGYPGLNNSGDIFYIGMTNTKTGEEYISFCANAGSKNFAGDNHLDCGGYYTSTPAEMDIDAFLRALNYIEDNIGNLNENRVITQTVIWALLGAVDVGDSALFEATSLTGEEKASIRDVMDNYGDYDGKGKIIDVVLMTCENPIHTFEYCQPQLVPVYRGFTFDNETDGEWDSSVLFRKVKYGGLWPIDVEYDEDTYEVLGFETFGFDLYKRNEDTGEFEKYGETYYTDVNGEIFVKDLPPGDYYFIEIPTTVYKDGLGYDEFAGSYNLVWQAIYPDGDTDCLWFVITKDGETEWGYLEEELLDGVLPVVNNIIYSKHHLMWAAGGEDEDPAGNIFIPVETTWLGEGKGWIIEFLDNCQGMVQIVEVLQPTCYRPGLVWLGCTDCSCTGFSFDFGEQLEHDYQAVAIAPGYGDGYVWFACPHGCSGSYVEYCLESWYALGGPVIKGDDGDPVGFDPTDDAVEYEAVALAPGYGDGYVWIVYPLSGAYDVIFDAAGWYALGGPVIPGYEPGDYRDEEPEYDAVALAPGYGDGYVWVVFKENGVATVLYDKDAWLDLGGYDFPG